MYLIQKHKVFIKTAKKKKKKKKKTLKGHYKVKKKNDMTSLSPS